MYEQKPRTPTLLSIQALRALAALAVAVAHTHYDFGRIATILGRPDEMPTFVTGAAGVDLFFVISGFVMVYSSEPLFARPASPPYFFLRRLARIAPLYWIATTIFVSYLVFVGPTMTDAIGSWQRVIASYLFIPSVDASGSIYPILPVGWTLNFEMFFYLVFSLALFFTRRVAVVLLCLTLGIFATLGGRVPMPANLAYLANPMLNEFLFGVVIAALYREVKTIPMWCCWALLMAGAAGFIACAIWDLLPLIRRDLLWGIPAACLVAGAAFAGQPQRHQTAWRAVGFLGDASYALYLFHAFAMTLPRHLMPGIATALVASWPWVYMVFLVFIALAVAIAVHLAVERNMTRVLQRLVDRTRPRFKAARPAGAVATP